VHQSKGLLLRWLKTTEPKKSPSPQLAFELTSLTSHLPDE
jgi:hypothetical protein